MFLDTTTIAGGAEWERAIDTAIRKCEVFAPVVTEASNDSRWVTRETLLALEIRVPIIPLLVSDRLPLRVIDRQFVDFRGAFSAGMADFLAALAKHISLPRLSQGAADRLIAAAIRARIRGDVRASNALVEQLIRGDDSLAASGYAFWRKLESALSTDFAKAAAHLLSIKEVSRRLPKTQYPGRRTYEWSVEILAPDDTLDAIDAVVYTLHPTFRDPVQRVRSREDRYRLSRVGWGTFPIGVRVEFVDYSTYDSHYLLTFETEHEEVL